jgi:type IV secretion system protein VirB5
VAASSTSAERTPPENPYLAGRREWLERYGDYISRERTWMMVAFGSLAIAMVAVAGVVWEGAQNKVVPYVVQVDHLGSAVAVGPAEQASQVDPRIISAELARWVFDMRTVSADAQAERHYAQDGYALIANGSAAFQEMNAHFTQNDPFQEAQTQTVQVHVHSVLPVAGDTWRVEWDEQTIGRDGTMEEPEEWQCDVTIAIHPPSDVATILVNPAGIYVTDFSWSKRL